MQKQKTNFYAQLSALDTFFAERDSMRSQFLSSLGLDPKKETPFGFDMSTRRFSRIERAGKSCVVMDSPSEESGFAAPEHRIKDFVKINEALRKYDLHVPEIYDLDLENGFLIMEDFGDVYFRDVVDQNLNDKQALHNIFKIGVDACLRMRDVAFTDDFSLPHFHDSHIFAARTRIAECYAPIIRQEQNPQSLLDDYNAAWDQILSRLPSLEDRFIHGDFHLQNLMYLPNEEGLAQCGILDFQGAKSGEAVYDLGNILEDARFALDQDVQASLLDYYFKESGANEEERVSYRIVNTLFHCRVLGQFIQVALNHKKMQYLNYVPSTQEHLRRAIDDPVLEPLKNWFEKYQIPLDGFDHGLLKNAHSYIDQGAA